MINRIDQRFQELGDTPAFVAYVCAGDPNMEQSLNIIKGLADAGADIIELGVPFSDPLADGVVNQMAAERALKAGATMQGVLQLIKDFRLTHDTPIVLFTYLNPIYAYGYEAFNTDALAAGADGVLLLDLPPDEAKLNAELSTDTGLKNITLIAPTSPDDRIASLAAQSEGFIYALSRTGVTGGQAAPSASIGDTVAQIKAHTKTPVCVGFGITTPEQSALVGSVSDGVVVGSTIVKVIAENTESPDVAEKVAAFTKPLIDAAKGV